MALWFFLFSCTSVPTGSVCVNQLPKLGSWWHQGYYYTIYQGTIDTKSTIYYHASCCHVLSLYTCIKCTENTQCLMISHKTGGYFAHLQTVCARPLFLLPGTGYAGLWLPVIRKSTLVTKHPLQNLRRCLGMRLVLSLGMRLLVQYALQLIGY